MADREHGTRARYVFGAVGTDRANGCRCEECREANRAYARDRDRRLKLLEPADGTHIDAAAARDHLLWLRGQGVGLRTVARKTGLARNTLQKIVTGGSSRCTAFTAELILGVGCSAGALVDGTDTWARIGDLLDAGWTRVAIARALHGPQAKALQLRHGRVSADNARAVAEIHAGALPHLAGRPRRRRAAKVVSRAGYPFSSLAAAVGVTDAALARQLGLRASRVRDLDDLQADELAVRMGLHPLEVWGTAWLVPA